MKNLSFSIVFLVAISFAVAQPAGFVLKGDVTKVNDPVEWVYLMYRVNNQNITDSVQPKQGSYQFAGNIAEAVQARLRVRYRSTGAGAVLYMPKKDAAMIFLEPGNIAVASVDSFANVTVTGSKADVEYRKLEAQAKSFNEKLDNLYKAYAAARKNKNETGMKALEEQIDNTNNEANEKIYANYVKQHPASPLAMYALRNWAGYDIDAEKVEPLFNTLPVATRNSPGGKDMKEKIDVAKKTSLGRVAMDFTQSDTAGVPVALSSLRGKYLLVDFWASWCGPCRAENPNVVKAFDKYKGKGFYILGVSLDRPGAKDKWIKAIHDDGLYWSQVSDLQYWDNAVAKQYGIQAIPQNLLLDPQGKIIGKNLRGEKLEKKLAELFPE
jgi:peroxiredoxin